MKRKTIALILLGVSLILAGFEFTMAFYVSTVYLTVFAVVAGVGYSVLATIFAVAWWEERNVS